MTQRKLVESISEMAGATPLVRAPERNPIEADGSPSSIQELIDASVDTLRDPVKER